jgi:hypothetical protein
VYRRSIVLAVLQDLVFLVGVPKNGSKASEYVLISGTTIRVADQVSSEWVCKLFHLRH